VFAQLPGAKVAGSPAELGAACDVVGICVFDAAGVEEVLFGLGGVVEGMAPGGVILVHSTIAPAQIATVADKAAMHGLTVLDAPVSGGAAAAAAGELLVILAGPAAACAKAMPVIGTYAGRVVRFDDVGAAQTAKLLNNSLLAAQVALVFDALRLGRDQGLGDALVDVFRAGSARSFALEVAFGAGSPAALAGGAFGPAVGKDVTLLADMTGPGFGSSLVLDTARDLIRQLGPPAAEKPAPPKRTRSDEGK
jgi:3-hydroxyisobutyrate dehydrogenase-like beta-hydroxyacid dehydrogenase